jgi:hypothetical protein
MLQRQATRTVVKIGGQVVKDFHVLSADLSTGGGAAGHGGAGIRGGPDHRVRGRGAGRFFAQGVRDQRGHLAWGPRFPAEYPLHHMPSRSFRDDRGTDGGDRCERGEAGICQPAGAVLFRAAAGGMRVRATPSRDGGRQQKSRRQQKGTTAMKRNRPRRCSCPRTSSSTASITAAAWATRARPADIRQVVFIPPEQLRISSLTGATSGSENNKALDAKTADGLEAEFWTLSTAVLMLCDCCNSDEGWIKNPTLAELKAAMGDRRQGAPQPQAAAGQVSARAARLTAAAVRLRLVRRLQRPDVRKIRVFARGRGRPGRSSCSRSASSSTC